MTAPDPAEPGPKPARLPADPTIRVARPPVPEPGKRAEVAADNRATSRAQPDSEPTVGLPGPAPAARQRTLQFGRPTPVKVTVSARPGRERRHRTWPWIAAVVLALIVLGAVLAVMLLRGATLDADTQLIGSDGSIASESRPATDAWPPPAAV